MFSYGNPQKKRMNKAKSNLKDTIIVKRKKNMEIQMSETVNKSDI